VNPMTTPEAPDLQRILSDMLAKGISHVVMEVSSHGIDRHRVDHCNFDVGVFTNLTQDHLDYHGDMNTYWSCKKRWFTEYLNAGPKRDRVSTVVNCDHPRGRELSELLSGSPYRQRLITTGHLGDNLVCAKDVTLSMAGISGRLVTPKGSFDLESSLVGKHNLENILCAIGVGEALDLSTEALKAGIESIAAVPGRLESVPNDRHRFVYVDYAHTPDALERVLSTLKKLSSGRLICVFGCGGNRDRGKRSRMGEIAVTYCDLAVVTSDNPRTEDPDRIIEDVCEGIAKSSPHRFDAEDLKEGFMEPGYVVDPDRRGAIALSLAASDRDDTILIAGKGDETYQIIGEQVLPFDDREEARRALSSL
jgi:UDP-N-acetylmuramoyl-L-alanyl-D-glutamate--2,6-diaminopimelate ligase